MDLTRILIAIGLAGLLLALIFSSGFRPWVQESPIPLNFQLADLVYECPVDGFTAVCGYNFEEQNEFVLYQLENGNVRSPEIYLPHQIFAYCKQSESDDVLLQVGSYCLIDLQRKSINALGYRFPGLENDFAFNDLADQIQTCNPYQISAFTLFITSICTVDEEGNGDRKLSPDGYNNIQPALNNSGDLVYICEDLFAFKWEPYRHLCTMELDGSEFREITPLDLHVHAFSLNDQGQIAFLCRDYLEIEGRDRNLRYDEFDLCMTQIDGSAPVAIQQTFVFASAPALNNRGDIAYRCLDTDSENEENPQNSICVVAGDGSEAMQLELDPAINATSLDLNDNGVIAFGCEINNSERNNEVCIINIDGTGFQQLTSDDSMAKHPDLR